MTMVAGIGSPGPSSGYGSSEEDRASSFSSRSSYFCFGSSSEGGRGGSTGPPSPVSPPTNELSCGLEFQQQLSSTDSDETGFDELPDILSMGDLDFVDHLISLDTTLNTNDR